jgi:hypothetical protein
MFSVVFAIGCQTIIRLMSAKNTANPVRLLLYAFLATQYVVLFYNPASRIPDTRDKQAGEHLLKTIKSYSGDVFIPFHNYLAALAGKKTYAHGPGLLIVLGRGGGTFNSTKPAQDLRREIDESITCKRFDAVMSDEYPYLFQNTRHVRENEEWFLLINKDLLDRCYEPAGKAFSEDHVTFFPTTGWFIRPSIIYVPRKSES